MGCVEKTAIALLAMLALMLPCGAAEEDLIRNGDFSQEKEGWSFLRCSFDPVNREAVFSPGNGEYFQLKQVVQRELPAGMNIRIEGELAVADPEGILRERKGFPQLLLLFETKDGKRLSSPGESGKAAALENTEGQFRTFSVTYRVPENTARIAAIVKTGVPLGIRVRRIRVPAEFPAEKVADGSFPFLIRGIAPDSVANYSFLNHAPAGKYGYLHDERGDFVFDNGETVRWFGLNLVASRVFDHSTHAAADEFAAKLAGLGINIVRIHHLTPSWQRAVPFYENREKSTLAFNDEAMEKLDYLLAALKKQGIYVTDEIVDSSLMPAPGEIPYEKLPSLHSFKLLMMIDPAVQDYTRKWIKAFFCRKNRYTGLSLFEDPQLAVIGIVNEISIGYHNGGLAKHLPPRGMAILQQRFRDYLNERNLPAEEFDPGLTRENSARFWDRLLRDSFSMWRNYIVSLGYRGLVSGSNFGENFYHMSSSSDMDFMDAHLYWGFAGYLDGVDAKTRFLPGDRWSDLVKTPRNEGAYTKELFARFSVASMPDKPLISSEHRTAISDFGRSAYRAVGLPFFSTLQAFQQWDGFYIFASQGDNSEKIGHRLDVKYDTTYLATFPLSAFLLRGGVVSPARQSLLLTCTEDDVYGNTRGLAFLHDGMFNLAEQHKLRILYPGEKTDESKFNRVVPWRSLKKMELPEKLAPTIVADTGEFYRNWEEGFFVVDTPRAQGAEGFFDRTSHFEFKDCSLAMKSPFGVFFVASGAAPSLTSAPRILFVAVGESVNSGDVSTKPKNWSLPGTPPVLVKPVKGILSFKNGKFDVWALGEKGERKHRAAADVAQFEFDTGRDKTVWYEFERKAN